MNFGTSRLTRMRTTHSIIDNTAEKRLRMRVY
jgi:hypothetical protein